MKQHELKTDKHKSRLIDEYKAVLNKCGDHDMNAWQNQNCYAYFLHGADAMSDKIEQQAARIDELEKGARATITDLKNGFVICSQCSHQDETKDFDAIWMLEEALSNTTPATQSHNLYDELVDLQALNNAHDGSTEVHDAIAAMIRKADEPATQGAEADNPYIKKAFWAGFELAKCFPDRFNILEFCTEWHEREFPQPPQGESK